MLKMKHNNKRIVENVANVKDLQRLLFQLASRTCWMSLVDKCKQTCRERKRSINRRTMEREELILTKNQQLEVMLIPSQRREWENSWARCYSVPRAPPDKCYQNWKAIAKERSQSERIQWTMIVIVVQVKLLKWRQNRTCNQSQVEHQMRNIRLFIVQVKVEGDRTCEGEKRMVSKGKHKQ